MRTKRKPAYCLHKPTGQARVRIDGKDHYLGEYRSPESLRRYDELIREWLATNTTERITLDVADLVLKYLDHARGYYRKDGRETSEMHGIQAAFRHLLKLHGKTLAADFSPLKLRAVRDAMIEAGFVRLSINQHVGRIKRLFRWATENELLGVEVYQSLITLPGLRRGRTVAKESEPVRPVEQGDVNAVLPFVSRPVAAMIRLQLFAGMRPGEVCIMRPCDVTLGNDGAWLYRPASHKTEHHGKERRIYLGPHAQAVLKPFLERDQESYCFSPIEAEADRNAEKRENRKSKRTPSQNARNPKRGRTKPPREHYTKDSYRRAVVRGCELAFNMPEGLRDIGRTIASMKDATDEQRDAKRKQLQSEAARWRKLNCWSPNQLRHSAATILRQRYGIETVQTILGHSDLSTSEIYAERDFALAQRVMSEVG